MHIRPLAAAALALAATFAIPAQAVVLTQWTFNTEPSDNLATTGTLAPAAGLGSASALGTSSAYFSGGGSTDPDTSANDSGWSLAGFAAQSTGNLTRGAQFLVSTAGFRDVVFSYDVRHSATAANTEVVQITLDGSSWANVATFTLDAANTWATRSVDLTGVAGVADNASFGLRVLAGFGNATSYVATVAGSSYGTAGTWRFDMVTVSAAPVPEPGTWATMLAGLAATGLMLRRRA